jgi:hypothetical protein
MIRILMRAAVAAAALSTLFAGLAGAQLKLPRVSPAATVVQTIGTTDLTVTYSRPGVKNRVIWGELVPYDKPWRTGANEATAFTTADEIQFGGQKLAAGTYSLFTIPTRDAWTVVINSEKDLWGAFEYKPDKDVLRVTLTPTPAEPQEWMSFSFEDLTPASANLVLRWEKLRVAVPITVDVNAKVLASCRAAVAAAKPDDWRTRVGAARWCMDNDQALDEAKGWRDQAVTIEKNYSTLNLLARWQMKEGKKQEAIATAQKAIAAGKASKDKVDTTQLEKSLAEWQGKKS